MVPVAAEAVIGMLVMLTTTYWPDMPMLSFLPAQIEQETCYSLTHSKCFNPRAELKTAREYGFGLGQITVTPSFNNFNTVKQLEPALQSWQWQDRFDREKQLVALLAMDRNEFRACKPLMQDGYNALACTAARYNGGAGGFNTDRRLCANTKGCDPRQWFGHVELYSTKAKVPASGYGKSFYQINREYVKNILINRRTKYAAYLGESP